MSELITHELRELEVRLLDPKARANAEFLEQVLAEDFVEIGKSGRMYDKRTVIAELLEEPGFSGERSVTQFQTKQVVPGVMLATYRIEETGPVRSSLWRQTQTAWQLVFNQGTPPLTSME